MEPFLAETRRDDAAGEQESASSRSFDIRAESSRLICAISPHTEWLSFWTMHGCLWDNIPNSRQDQCAAQRVGELGLGIPFSSDINSSEKCLLAQGSVTLGCHDVREYDKQMRKD